METKIEMLNYIKKNSEEGKKTTRELIDVSDNPKFIKMLTKQHEGYEKFEETISSKIYDEYTTPDSLNPLESISSYMMVKIGTMVDKSSSHIANLLIDGRTEGIAQLNGYMDNYEENNHEQSILNLAQDYIRFEKSNIQELREYL